MKGKMELTMGVAVGSSIQIAAGMSASPRAHGRSDLSPGCR